MLFCGMSFAADSGWIDMLRGSNLSGWTRIAIPPHKPVNEKQCDLNHPFAFIAAVAVVPRFGSIRWPQVV